MAIHIIMLFYFFFPQAENKLKPLGVHMTVARLEVEVYLVVQDVLTIVVQ